MRWVHHITVYHYARLQLRSRMLMSSERSIVFGLNRPLRRYASFVSSRPCAICHKFSARWGFPLYLNHGQNWHPDIRAIISYLSSGRNETMEAGSHFSPRTCLCHWSLSWLRLYVSQHSDWHEQQRKSYISILLCAAEVQTHKTFKITLTPSLLCRLFDNTVTDTSNNTKATLACWYVLQRLKYTNP